MDTGPDLATIKAKRAKEGTAADRRARKAAKRAGVVPVADRRRGRRSWAARANALCDRTYDEMLELVRTSTASSPRDIVRLLDASLRISGRFIVRLERLGPPPNRRVHARLMRELRTSQAADRRSLQALERRWSQRALVRAVRESEQRGESLRRLAERLDTVACSQLFDPIAFA